jgi:hypothetical protein
MTFTDFPFPPTPDKATLLIAAAGCAVAGCLLLIRGGIIGRLILGAAAGAVAWQLAPQLGVFTRLNQPLLVGASVGISAGLITFVLARLAWAVAIGGTLAAVGLVVMSGYLGSAHFPVIPAGPFPDIRSWAAALAGYFLSCVPAMWSANIPLTLAAIAVPALGALALAIYAPRVLGALAGSLYGSAAVLLGVVLGVWAIQPAWLKQFAAVLNYYAILGGVLALVGVALQLRRAQKESLGGMEHGSSYKR